MFKKKSAQVIDLFTKIVYCSSKDNCQKLFDQLSAINPHASTYLQTHLKKEWYILAYADYSTYNVNTSNISESFNSILTNRKIRDKHYFDMIVFFIEFMKSRQIEESTRITTCLNSNLVFPVQVSNQMKNIVEQGNKFHIDLAAVTFAVLTDEINISLPFHRLIMEDN